MGAPGAKKEAQTLAEKEEASVTPLVSGRESVSNNSMRFVKVTEYTSGETIAVNASLVYGIRHVQGEEGGPSWTNLLIVAERFPQNVVSVQEAFNDVVELFSDRLM